MCSSPHPYNIEISWQVGASRHLDGKSVPHKKESTDRKAEIFVPRLTRHSESKRTPEIASMILESSYRWLPSAKGITKKSFLYYLCCRAPFPPPPCSLRQQENNYLHAIFITLLHKNYIRSRICWLKKNTSDFVPLCHATTFFND